MEFISAYIVFMLAGVVFLLALYCVWESLNQKFFRKGLRETEVHEYVMFRLKLSGMLSIFSFEILPISPQVQSALLRFVGVSNYIDIGAWYALFALVAGAFAPALLWMLFYRIIEWWMITKVPHEGV